MSETIQIEVRNASGKVTSKKEVRKDVFGLELHGGLLHQAVRRQRAEVRSGTHQVKTRASASGGGAKPWRQKGTGRARAGSNTSPLWVGGGIAHGPKQRDYSFGVNKKERQKAIFTALSARFSEGCLLAVDDFGLEAIKTKAASQVLQAIGVPSGQKVLVVVSADDEKVTKSLRNLPKVKVISPQRLNVYDILNARYVLFVGDTLESVDGRLQK